MKTHLIKFVGNSETDFHTLTYCGMDSDKWSEEFYENSKDYLTDIVSKCTCKRCLHKIEEQRDENN